VVHDDGGGGDVMRPVCDDGDVLVGLGRFEGDCSVVR
jgi:hypothetical protein